MKKSIVTLLTGLFVFIASLVFLINSISFEDYGEYGRDFSINKDYMVLVLVGVALIIVGAVVLYNYIKKDTTNNDKVYTTGVGLCGTISFFYALTVIIKQGAKGNIAGTSIYWLWLVVSLLVVAYVFAFNLDKKHN